MFNDEHYAEFAFILEVTCNLNDKGRIPDSWIILDINSTVELLWMRKLSRIF